MHSDRRQLHAFALLGIVMVLWAGNSIVARAVRFDVPPLTLAFVRWAGASLILLPFVWRPLRRDWPAILASWKPVLVLGLLGVGAFNAFLYSGLRYTTATNALLLQAGIPALVVLFDRLFFGERSPLVQNVGVACSILGVLAIVFEGDPARALRLHFGIGDVLILISVLAWALYTVLLRLRPGIAPVSFVAVTFFIGVIAMAPLAAYEWHSGERIVWSAGTIGAFAYVAVLPSIVSYFIFNHATATVGAARAGQAITLMPVVGAFMTAGLLGEKLAGAGCDVEQVILVGIALSIRVMRRQVQAGPPGSPPLEQRP